MKAIDFQTMCFVQTMEEGKPLFDVNMGNYDGAEICELVGLYLLSKPSKPSLWLAPKISSSLGTMA